MVVHQKAYGFKSGGLPVKAIGSVSHCKMMSIIGVVYGVTITESYFETSPTYE